MMFALFKPLLACIMNRGLRVCRLPKSKRLTHDSCYGLEHGSRSFPRWLTRQLGASFVPTGTWTVYPQDIASGGLGGEGTARGETHPDPLNWLS